MEERPGCRVVEEDVLAAVDVDGERGAALLVVCVAPGVVGVVVLGFCGPGVGEGERSVIALVIRCLCLQEARKDVLSFSKVVVVEPMML